MGEPLPLPAFAVSESTDPPVMLEAEGVNVRVVALDPQLWKAKF
jgi:hypothetical protein